jgi:hypothetical protein
MEVLKMKVYIKIMVIAAILFSIFFNEPLISQDKKEKSGKIEKFEKALDKKQEDKPKEKTERRHHEHKHHRHGRGNSFVGEFIIRPLFEYTFLYVFIGPPGDYAPIDREFFARTSFAEYPYETGDVGFYSNMTSKHYAVTLSGNYFYNNPDLHGYSFRGRFYPSSFLGAELRFTDLIEDLPAKSDHLQIYDVLVNYHRVREQRWTLWWGLGMKGINGDKNHKGMALNLGTEIYLKKPVSLYMNYNVGLFNDINAVKESRYQLNWHINRNKIYIGYHRFSTGSAVLDGVVAGIGIYF